MNVGELKRLLHGVPNGTPIYIKNHDNGNYENAGIVTDAQYLNQHNSNDEIEDCFKIDGDYFVISA